MWFFPEEFDVIVVGAGHAGCEAAHAAAKMGAKTLLLTMNLDTVAKMSCNPTIGGTAKGHIVREIDAMGGIMGKIADQTGIQFRMLNRSKGPAVWSPRCQSDRAEYALAMKQTLENTDNLYLAQGTTSKLCIENDRVIGIETVEGIAYKGKSVILSSGTFMKGTIHIGDRNYSGGRAGDKPSVGLSHHLEELGFSLGRLKTGTPPRIHARSVDFSEMEEQKGEEDVHFSHDGVEKRLPQTSCFITHTTKETQRIAEKNLKRSALYGGHINSVGPRYCPSFEDKVVRFADKDRHQIYLEPEGLCTSELYVNGISTSLPFDVQIEMLKSIQGLENAEIMRAAYAIEYDYMMSGQVALTLESKLIEGLYFSGQINGTTGYEEAAGQGMIAGINAALKVRGDEPFYLKRSEAYLGVMIEDIISKTLEEPYRMFTSRAEHRLLLRQDNADLRLRNHGYNLGLVSKEQHETLTAKNHAIADQITILSKAQIHLEKRQLTLSTLLCRPEVSYSDLIANYPTKVKDHGNEINRQIEISLKYAGYIEKQEKEIAKLEKLDNVKISAEFDYLGIKGMRHEAKERLTKVRPENLGQASRLDGITPADISILLLLLSKQ